ncbi:hypothetical protein WMY93_031472 [Mugilogobius chulae]|uniref:Uncharacterized protein n=1 Tax=Mugilogobius chulae TaxID=88201 RepID=A0AAW0MG71_9GOBI
MAPDLTPEDHGIRLCKSGLNMDRPPAGAKVRIKHGPASCWCQKSGLNMDLLLLVSESGLNTTRPPAESGLNTTGLLLVRESGLNMDRPPAGARVRTKHACLLLVSESGLKDRPPAVPEQTNMLPCWCQSQD